MISINNEKIYKVDVTGYARISIQDCVYSPNGFKIMIDGDNTK